MGRLIVAQLSVRWATNAHDTLFFTSVLTMCAALSPALLIATNNSLVVLVFSALSGLFFAGLYPLILALTVNCGLFGDPQHGQSNGLSIGVLLVASNCGSLALPALLGAVAEHVGSIRWCILLASGALALCFTCLTSFGFRCNLYHCASTSTTAPSLASVVPAPTSASAAVPPVRLELSAQPAAPLHSD